MRVQQKLATVLCMEMLSIAVTTRSTRAANNVYSNQDYKVLVKFTLRRCIENSFKSILACTYAAK